MYELGVDCNFWFYKVDSPTSAPVVYGIYAFFPAASLMNVTIISLERLHAPFYRLRHLGAVKKRTYGVVIFAGWVIIALLSWTIVILYLRVPTFLFVIVTSYFLIFITVRCSAQPHRHGVAGRERKLTVTLVIVTAVSLLMWLPFITRRLLRNPEFHKSLPCSVDIRIYYVVDMLFFGNSFVNPILYAIRIPGFKRALIALFCKSKPQIVLPGFPLRDI